ncbi:hypothetical protein ACQUQP_15630 [Marinobacterium sp. YM272]|uniref:hypothetical protein n=1 Tax=Marinobacterium sp. YM272 TaxID=3421654 RepID=UPI003D7FAB18
MSKQTEQPLNVEFILKRRLKLTGLSVDPEIVQARLTELSGIAAVKWREQRLELRYDASRLQLDQVLEVLAGFGISPHRGRLERLRLNWYRMTDRNTWDSSRHVPHCCNKSPR